MSALATTHHPTAPPSPVYITATEAEAFSRLSIDFLRGRQKQGVDTGMRKHGRRTVFNVEALRRFMEESSTAPAR